jgi:hypothetical protein
MKIVKETPLDYVKVDVDFEEEEYAMLLAHGKKNIPPKELDDLILEWAFIDAMKNGIKLMEKKKKARKKKEK